MSGKPISYRWEVNGKRALNPSAMLQSARQHSLKDEATNQLLSIDCPRGAHPGKAFMLLLKEDAESLLSVDSHQVITITSYEQTAQGNWVEVDSTGFGGYYALSSSCVFGKIQNQVLVEFADERHKFATSHVRKRFNVLTKKPVESSEPSYDQDTLNEGDPYTYGEILDEILSAVEAPPSLFLPVDPDPPNNLVFDCSVADAIDQLLASIGCALLFDPTAETGDEYSVEELSIDQDLAVLDDAIDEGRLIEKYNPKNGENLKPKSTIIFPAKIVTLASDAKLIPLLPNSLGDPSTDFPSVDILDHELEPNVERINDAVDAWYKPLENPRSDIYQGILLAKTGSDVTSVTWAFTPNGHRTLVKNLLPSAIPWPQQPTLLNSQDLVRFTLTDSLASGGTATATPTGTESSESITVTDWAGNSGESGDKGIAWKDGDTYRVIEIKRGKSSELVRFTLEEDIDTASHLAGATIVSSGEDDGESIEVIDWCRNGGKEGDNGIAWQVRNSETGASEYYIVEIKQNPRVQFIQGTTSTAGDFESVAADSFSLQAIVGVDREWDGDETITVHNPLKIKVWDSDCVIKCQWNQDEERYEVLAATQKYVMHGVRIYKFSTTCRFEKLDSTGISNWNDETFPDVVTTSPNWVTEVFVAGTAPNQTLRYKTYCMDVSNTGVQILEIGNACS